jgi:hypothetical protein
MHNFCCTSCNLHYLSSAKAVVPPWSCIRACPADIGGEEELKSWELWAGRPSALVLVLVAGVVICCCLEKGGLRVQEGHMGRPHPVHDLQCDASTGGGVREGHAGGRGEQALCPRSL